MGKATACSRCRRRAPLAGKKRCARCTDERNADRRKVARMIADAKKGPCTCCGGLFPTQAMDLHHVDRAEKRGALGTVQAGRWGRERALRELEKCVLVCSVCHRILEAWIEERMESKELLEYCRRCGIDPWVFVAATAADGAEDRMRRALRRHKSVDS